VWEEVMKVKSHDFSSKVGPGAVWVFSLVVIALALVCLAEAETMEDRRMGSEELELVRMTDVGLAPQVGPDGASNLSGIALNAEETKLYVSDLGNAKVKVVDLATEEVAATIQVGENPYYLAARPKSDEIWATSSDGNVYVINTKKDKVSRLAFHTSSEPVSIAFDRTGKYAAVGDSDGNVHTFKASNGLKSAICQVGDSIHGIAVLGKKLLYATTNDGWVARAEGKCKVDGIDTGQTGGWGLTLTSDRKYVVAATDKTSIIDAKKGKFLGQVADSYSNYFVSSPDGTIVYGTRDVKPTEAAGVEKIDPETRTLSKFIPTGDWLPGNFELWGITMAEKSSYLYATTSPASALVTVIDSSKDEVVKVIVVP
jgi:YVTN family beta-propeller protein